MIKAIIFDCFGVLTTDTWKEFVATLPHEQKEQAGALNHALDAGVIDKPTFFSEIQALTGRQPNYVEAFVDNEMTKNTDLLEYIAELKKLYKIGMISNVASNWVRDHLLTGEEQGMFAAMVFSFEVGATKPDPKIYYTATERLGVKPGECVFIDDVERYCSAAEELGMAAICYKDNSQLKAELERLLDNSER